MTGTFADQRPNPLSDAQKASGRLTQARDAKRRKIVQALTAQEVFYKDMTNNELPPKDRSMAARAWIELQDCIRILKGKPLPGVLKPGDRVSRPQRKLATISALDIYKHAASATPMPAPAPPPSPPTDPQPK